MERRVLQDIEHPEVDLWGICISLAVSNFGEIPY